MTVFENPTPNVTDFQNRTLCCPVFYCVVVLYEVLIMALDWVGHVPSSSKTLDLRKPTLNKEKPFKKTLYLKGFSLNKGFFLKNLPYLKGFFP